MKNVYPFIALLAIMISTLSFAQTPAERAKIVENYDMDALRKIEAERLANKRKLIQKAFSLNIPIKFKMEDGRVAVLESITDDGIPLYSSTRNLVAARTIEVDELRTGGSLGLDLDGSGIDVVVWDGGAVRATHESLQGRTTQGELLFTSDDHATHVTGTIIGDDPFPNVDGDGTGMAPAATATIYNFDNDETEIPGELQNGMIISNHSYGLIVNSSFPKERFGKYETSAREWDQLAFSAPYWLSFISAGNDRSGNPNPTEFGYDILTGNNMSKNAISVGAIFGFNNYPSASNVQMSNFSSWGPSDDGRIKPDLVGNGVSVLSAHDTADDAYLRRQGTSMSAPTISGGYALLQQYYNQLNNVFMTSASGRALLINTTREAGDDPGPDYSFGHGVANMEDAAKIIRDNGDTSLILENTLTQGASYSKTFTAAGNAPIKVALSWTDRPGTPNSGPEDDPTPAIVNDLDVKITDSNGNDTFPWNLDPANPSAAAFKAVNNVDTTEKIEIDNPSGTYTITVTHKGNLVGGSQDYSLVVSGGASGTFSSGDVELTEFAIYPNPADDRVNVSFLNDNGNGDVQITIYNVLGQQAIAQTFRGGQNFKQSLDISQLQSGIYLIKVDNGSATSTKKLIVK